ncbi:unnamed protein product [Adineta steineri]|uniref:Uncharacterized protein n=1 Tax=Adineta steineri TaxID=433720 RepID=A0A818JRY3_9BILA|nr:unnamed protein product [Adineta steineri]CAF0883091.1 unnamed protein product [Adineta steineri]CAF3544055.1 unnamed protein product [Adineta steineri]CAF3559773.1 unnamed protein product [Adineta steineri]
MNIYNQNELSTTSESDSEYLVDSRYCRTTVKCKRKALKKTIKLIHGRCIVIYRGSGDLLSIAAKDADRNCYYFVFVCYDPKPTKSTMPRSRSAIHDSSTSNDDDNINNNNHSIFQKRFIPSNMNQQLTKQNSFSFKTKLNNENTNESISTETKSSIKNSYDTKHIHNNRNKNLNERILHEEINVDIEKLIDTDEPSPSIIYFPSSHLKSI